MPTPAHSGPDTSRSGRTQRVLSSSAAAAVFVHVPAAAVVLRHELHQGSATPVLELDVVAAPSASDPGPEAGPGAVARSAVAVAVTAVGLEAAAGFGAGSELEFVPAEGESLPVEAVPEDSTMASDRPAPDMVASTPSGIVVVLVVKEAVLGVAAIGVALPHKRHFDLDWRVGQDAVVYKQPQPQHLGTRHIPSGCMGLCSTHSLAAGRQAGHNQGLAVREHATQGAGM